MKTIAIVGRPNVGKSTLFNRLCGRDISIVDDAPGITRDRIYAETNWAGVEYALVDTGGIDLKNKDELQRHITTQATIAVDLADAILFVVDARSGVTQGDLDAAKILKRSKKPIILVVNKLDNKKQEDELGYEFVNLGLSNMFFISATLGLGIGELLDEVIKVLCEIKNKKVKKEDEDNKRLRVAIVGRPNVGKSSLINSILGDTRLVVGEVAGTTRDSVDTFFSYGGKDYTLVDTAGIRKKSVIDKESLESLFVVRSLASIRRCNVAVLVIDASEGLTDQDQKLVAYINSQGKPCIFACNKYDLLDEETKKNFEQDMNEKLGFMKYYKSISVSAKTGKNVLDIIKHATNAFARASKRVTTGTLNQLLHEAFRLSPPANVKGQSVKLFYATQSDICPPTFVLFVKNANIVQTSYIRYIENFIRKSIDFTAVPIRILLRDRGEADIE